MSALVQHYLRHIVCITYVSKWHIVCLNSANTHFMVSLIKCDESIYAVLFDHHRLTTGNRAFAECKLLCRVSKIGHSTKTFFVECRTRQRIALGKEFFAECRTLGKWLLCQVPGSRQKRGTRHRLPRVTVFGHVLLCRVPAVWHSAKIFFWKILCRVPLTRRSAKIQYFFLKCLCRVSTNSALGKERN